MDVIGVVPTASGHLLASRQEPKAGSPGSLPYLKPVTTYASDSTRT